MQGEYVLPFNVPYKGNARTFNFIHSIFTQARSRTLTGFQLLYKGFKWMRAIIDIQSVTSDKASLSLRLNLSALECMNMKLRDFDYGEDVDMGADRIAFANMIATFQNYPDTHYNFPPVYNEAFYGEGSESKNPDYFNIMNNWDTTAGVYLDNAVSNKNTLVPMVYLQHIINIGFQHEGYSVKVDQGFMADVTKKNLLVYNNQSIDKKSTLPTNGMLAGILATLPFTTHTAAMGEHTIIFNNDYTMGCYDTLSAFNNVTSHYTIQATGQHQIKMNLEFKPFGMTSPSVHPTIKVTLYKNGIPFHVMYNGNYNQAGSNFHINVTWWFTAIAANIGEELWLTLEIIMPGNTNPNGYYRMEYSSFGVNDLPPTTPVNNFKQYWNMRDHVPDITFGELLNAIKETYNLVYKIDPINKTVRILYFEELMQQQPRDLSKKTITDHEIKFDNSVTIKSLNYTFGSNDANSSNSWKEYDQTKYLGEVNSATDLVNNDATLVGYFAYVKCLHQIWRCNDLGTSVYKWQYYTEAYEDVVVNVNGAIEIRPKLSPLFTKHREYVVSATPHYQIMPCIKQLGSSDEFGLGKNPYDLHLIHYMGIVPDFCDESSVPTASSTCTLPNGTKLQTNLTWKKDDMLTYWDKLIYILSFAEITIKKFKLNLSDLLNFDITALYFFDSTHFIARNAQINISDDIKEIEMELHKLPIDGR